MSKEGRTPQRVIGRYAVYDEIAAGGMATIHIGRLVSEVGFSRTVAIKRLHANLAKDPEFVSMFLDEARLASRIRHPSVIPTLDVMRLDGELFLVMDYVQGESLGMLLRSLRRTDARVPPSIALRILCDTLDGLHAAHEAKSERGEPLDIVHRDVSPQNILVGVDGTSRVIDFGIAKAMGRLHSTRQGIVKGKLGYMAPEHFLGGSVTRRSDIYAAAIVLWEVVTGKRLFSGSSEAEIVTRALQLEIPRPKAEGAEISDALDAAIMRGLERDPENRFATAREMELALRAAGETGSAREVGEWVHWVMPATIAKRARRIEEIESGEQLEVTPPDAVDSDQLRNGPTLRPPSMAPSSNEAGENSRTVTVTGVAAVENDLPVPGLIPWRRRFGLLGLGAACCCVVLGLYLLKRPASGGGRNARSAPAALPESAAPTRSARSSEPSPMVDASAEAVEAVAPITSSSARPAASGGSSPRPSPPAGLRGPAPSAGKRPVDQLLGRD